MKLHLDDLDIGIWSIARPETLKNLKELLPQEIIEKLSSCDELAALYKLSGEEAAVVKIQDCVNAIIQEISISKDKNAMLP